MTDIKLDVDHDLLIDNSDISIFTNIENLTVQKVKINLLNLKGEWFRDINSGIPYTQSILGKRNTQLIADSFIKNAIISTEGIDSITSYESSINSDRTLNVIFSAITESGEIVTDTVEI